MTGHPRRLRWRSRRWLSVCLFRSAPPMSCCTRPSRLQQGRRRQECVCRAMWPSLMNERTEQSSRVRHSADVQQLCHHANVGGNRNCSRPAHSYLPPLLAHRRAAVGQRLPPLGAVEPRTRCHPADGQGMPALGPTRSPRSMNVEARHAAARCMVSARTQPQVVVEYGASRLCVRTRVGGDVVLGSFDGSGVSRSALPRRRLHSGGVVSGVAASTARHAFEAGHDVCCVGSHHTAS
jgi:hypothetical protein